MDSKNIFMNNFYISDDLRNKANNYLGDYDVIECANSIKDSAKKFEKLNSREKQAAAIILSKKLLEEEHKQMK